RGHAGAPLVTGNGDAVDIGVSDTRKQIDRFRNLGGGDVLALPTEGVADAIDKIKEAVRVLPHQVAGAKPEVPRREDVAQDLLLSLAIVGVTFKAIARLGRVVEDLADRLTDLSDGTWNA